MGGFDCANCESCTVFRKSQRKITVFKHIRNYLFWLNILLVSHKKSFYSILIFFLRFYRMMNKVKYFLNILNIHLFSQTLQTQLFNSNNRFIKKGKLKRLTQFHKSCRKNLILTVTLPYLVRWYKRRSEPYLICTFHDSSC